MFYGRDYISYRSDPENQIPKGRVGGLEMQGNVPYFTHMNKPYQNFKQLHAEVARLLKESKDDAFIIDHLQQQGVEKYYAEMILENVREDWYKRRQLRKHLVLGLSAILASFLLTVIAGEKAQTLLGVVVDVSLGIYGATNVARGLILFWK